MADTDVFEKRKARAAIVVRELARLFPKAKVFLNYRTPWELLVAVMLSARCTDKKVNEVTESLFPKYRTVPDYADAKQIVFERNIHAAGFYRTKAKNIRNAARMVLEQFGGEVPRTMDELLMLPGVGRKTANIVLENAFGIVVGIPVDTHVGRLARVFGLSGETDPEKIERDLMGIIPKRQWRGLSYKFIEYGRAYCPARKHDHAKCPLSQLLEL